MKIWAELKRRNVFRVAAAYAVVAWLIVQVGDVAADNLGFPDWFMPMLFVVLGLGFPVAPVRGLQAANSRHRPPGLLARTRLAGPVPTDCHHKRRGRFRMRLITCQKPMRGEGGATCYTDPVWHVEIFGRMRHG